MEKPHTDEFRVP